MFTFSTKQQQALERFLNPLEVRLLILFGSKASGKSDAASDLDLALLGYHPKSLADYTELVDRLQKIFSETKVDLAFLDVADPVLRWQVARQGKLLYGPPSAFRRFQIQAWKEYLDSKDLRDLEAKMTQKRLTSLQSK